MGGVGYGLGGGVSSHDDDLMQDSTILWCFQHRSGSEPGGVCFGM
jgi:hypothetical protein